MVMTFVSFFFYDTPPPEIYTLSLHDALPISADDDPAGRRRPARRALRARSARLPGPARGDRKSTRLNSSHGYISYAVFCLKKKKKKISTDVKYNVPSVRLARDCLQTHSLSGR